MPTLMREGPYRFFVFSGDGIEPPHIHVERDKNLAKFWISPVRIESSGGFSPTELMKVFRLVERYETDLIRKWNEYFSN